MSFVAAVQNYLPSDKKEVFPLWIEKKIIPSTNEYLESRLSELPDRALCFAEHQTRGKGQHGRQGRVGP